MTNLLTDELTTTTARNAALSGANKKAYFLQNLKIQKLSIELGDVLGKFNIINNLNFLEELVRGLAEKTITLSEWRDLCRAIGYRYSAIHLHVSPEQWKLVRDVLVYSVVISSQTLVFLKFLSRYIF